MEKKKTSKGCLIASVISLVVTGLELLSVFFIILCVLYSCSGTSASAITNEFAYGFVGVLFFIAVTMIISAIGGLTGLIVAIVDLVKKQYKLIWMPIISVLLGIGPWLLLPLILVVIEVLGQ